MEEEWKQIIQAPNYEVSNLGHVRNNYSGQNLNPIKKQNGCYIINLFIGNPDNKPNIKRGEKQIKYTMAKLLVEHFMENYDPNKNTKHVDKNKSNFVISNLYQKQ